MKTCSSALGPPLTCETSRRGAGVSLPSSHQRLNSLTPSTLQCAKLSFVFLLYIPSVCRVLAVVCVTSCISYEWDIYECLDWFLWPRPPRPTPPCCLAVSTSISSVVQRLGPPPKRSKPGNRNLMLFESAIFIVTLYYCDSVSSSLGFPGRVVRSLS